MTKRCTFLFFFCAIIAQAQPTARLSRETPRPGAGNAGWLGHWRRYGCSYRDVVARDDRQHVRVGGRTGLHGARTLCRGHLVHESARRWHHRRYPLEKLTVGYALTQRSGPLDARAFASHILTQYRSDIQRLKTTPGDNPAPFEANARRMAWLQEWAKVARPYAAQNWPVYVDALSGFYGGEMTCAGLLYAPVLGTLFPGQPERAYAETFRLAIFDLSYARDMTALTGAMMATALTSNPTPETVMNGLRDVDPQGYFQSRLVGRVGYRALERARSVVYKANQWTPPAVLNTTALVYPRHGEADTLALTRRQYAFTQLDGYNQDSPIKSGEIFQITLTAMLYGQFDFLKSLQFGVNFGRNNDTTGAIIGAILGAYHGADKLPKDLVNQVLTVNKKHTETDLAKLADDLTEVIWARQGK